MDSAIRVDNVTKVFRLEHASQTSLKEALIKFRRRRTYEEFKALDDVSLDVPKGSVLGLIGPNGSGKSTLLKCLARILTPTEGSIQVHGRMAALLELGTGFHPELSGRDNIYMNGSILGLSRREIDARYDEIVAWSELERFIDNPIKTYSSGMVVRLGFSVATTLDPEILLVDEVLAVGDMNFRRKSADKMRSLITSGATIVMVAHDLSAIRSMCDRAVFLETGRVQATGDVDDVLDAYRDRMAQLRGSTEQDTDEATSLGAVRRVEIRDLDDNVITHADVHQPFRIVATISRNRIPEPSTIAATLRATDTSLVGFQSSGSDFLIRPGTGDVEITLTLERPGIGPGVYGWTVALRALDGGQLIDRHDFAVDLAVGKPDASGNWRSMPVALDIDWHQADAQKRQAHPA